MATPRQIRRRGRFALIVGTVLAAATIVAVAGATVSTDQADYTPGSTVHILGDGLTPGASATIGVERPDGVTETFTVTASSGGAFTYAYLLPGAGNQTYPDPVLGDYRVTATDGEHTFETSFADGNGSVKLAGGPTSGTVDWGKFNGSTSCSGTANTTGSTPVNNSTFTVLVGVNSGQSIEITAPTIAGYTFSGWTGATTSSDNPLCYAPTSNSSFTLTANYTPAASNSPPAISSDHGTLTVDEGSQATNTGIWSDADSGDTVSLSASVGSVVKSGSNSNGTWSWSYTPDDGPSDSQTVTITADDGHTTTQTTFGLTVNNVAPTGTFGTPSAHVNEGSSFNLDISGVTDPSTADTTAGFTYAFDCGDGSGYSAFGSSSTATCNSAIDGPATLDVGGKVQDKDGGVSTYTGTVMVDNVPPVITSFTCPTDPVAVGTPVLLGGSFTDVGILDTHTANYDWGDGTSAGIVTENNGSGSVSGSHTYTSAGIYTPVLTVTDKDGGFATEPCASYVVVYDPSAGFVTGGGWIMSPAGAYVADPSMTGKATFGFVSKYKKGANVPDGNTEFQFHAAGLNFSSTSYQWLVVSGSKATYKGFGTINGAGNYGFLLSAIDGSPDKFRIKIWDIDNAGAIVYDNNIGGDATDTADPATALGGGSIVIQTGKSK